MPSVYVWNIDPNCAVCFDFVKVWLPSAELWYGWGWIAWVWSHVWFVSECDDDKAFAIVDR